MFFRKLRERIARRLVEIKHHSRQRQREVVDFRQAKTAGLVFSTTSPEDYHHIKAFINYLKEQQIEVTPLVYVDEKKVPDYYYLNKDLIILTRKDLSWLHLPGGYNIKKFIKTPFHILIDLSTSFHLPLYYIVCFSAARFKIGRYEEKEYYDLMIDISANKTTQFLIEQIKHYVSILKNPY